MNEDTLPPPLQQDTFPNAEIVAPKKKNWVTSCLVGCLIASGLCCVLCAGTGYFVYRNFRQYAGDLARSAIAQTIEASELPEDEKAAVIAQVDRVVEAYQNEEISNAELGEILEDLAKSPLMGLIVIQGVEAKYVVRSGLSSEEKAAARRTIMRVLRGAVEEKIDESQIESLSEHFLLGDEQNRQLKQRLTDDELRAFLTEAAQIADAAEIPDEDYELRISARIREIVDEALGEVAAE